MGEKIDDPRHPVSLGQLIAYYPSSISRSKVIIKTLVAILLFVIPPLAIGYWRYYYGYTQFGVVPADIWSRAWFALAMINLVICLLFSLHQIFRRRQFVALYENGLTIRSGILKISTLVWDQLSGILTDFIQERILHQILRNNVHAILQLKDETTISLPQSLINIPELISRIKARLYSRLVPEIVANFNSGKLINFGIIDLHSNKLIMRDDSNASNVLELNQIEEITVQSGYLVLTIRNQVPKKVMVSKILNLEIMLHLLRGEVNYEMA